MSAEEENKNQTSTPENDSTSSETANNSGSDTQNSDFENTNNQNTSNKSDSSSTDSARSSADKSSETKSEVKADAKKLEHEPEAKGKESDLTKVGKSDSKFKAKAKDLGKKAGNRVKDGVKSKAQNIKDAVNNSVFINRLKKMFQIIKKVVKFIITHIKIIAIVTGIVLLVGGLVLTVISMSEASGETPHYYCDIDPDPDLKKTSFYKQYCTNGGLAIPDMKTEFAYILGKIMCNEEHILYSQANQGPSKYESEGLSTGSAWIDRLCRWDFATPLTEAHYICCASFVSICLYKAGIIEWGQMSAGCNLRTTVCCDEYSLRFNSDGSEDATRKTKTGWKYVGGLCMSSGSINMTADEFVEKYIDDGELKRGDVILYRHANSNCPLDKHDHVTLCSGKLTEEETDDQNLIGKWCEIEAATNDNSNNKYCAPYNPGQVPRDKAPYTNHQVCENPINPKYERTIEVFRYVGDN